uniref:Sodium/potassium-transporting ATPase subunit beta n=1 Tax=Neogobius melanostomus TaxID=47308 RepID=A0A8C6UK31_9GOBI
MASAEDKPASKENASSWKDSFYNPRTGEVLGRTPSSCSSTCVLLLPGRDVRTDHVVMLQTLDDYVPRYRDRVPFRVTFLHVITLYSYPITILAIAVLKIGSFLDSLSPSGYNDTIQEQNMNCPTGEYFVQDDAEEKKVCSFKRGFLSACSGLSDTNFGYSDGQPCILLKLNRIIGLKPRGEPYINCTLKVNLPLVYFPHEGRIDKKYFPYYGKKAHENYVQPLVAVKLLLGKDDWNKEHALECRVDGSDLRNNDERDKYLGRVTSRHKGSILARGCAS